MSKRALFLSVGASVVIASGVFAACTADAVDATTPPSRPVVRLGVDAGAGSEPTSADDASVATDVDTGANAPTPDPATTEASDASVPPTPDAAAAPVEDASIPPPADTGTKASDAADASFADGGAAHDSAPPVVADTGAGGGTTIADTGTSTTTHDAGASTSADAGASTSDAGSTTSYVWRKANLTNFESYPAPGSAECVQYNGCTWAGQFAALDGVQPLSWVESHDIVAVHSKDFATYKLKTLRIRQGTNQIDATVYDECADSDCSGCCTANEKQTGFLIDMEKYTVQRFGGSDGIVEWTCLDCP